MKGDSVGIVDKNGKTIVPLVHRNLDGVKDREKIKGKFINLPPIWSDTSRKAWGIVYNRKGTALYAPYFYDNGPDWLEEGLSRYVENNKIGFVNRIGEKVIKAQWDYVSSFNYGVATFCNGCKLDFSEDSEHPSLKGGLWGYINYKGEIVELVNEKKSDKDQIYQQQFIPYPFSYSLFEKNILDFLYKQDMISKAYFVNHYSPLDNIERMLHFEIIERPSNFFPYYHVKSFEFTRDGGYYGGGVSLSFYVSKDGKEYYFNDYADELIKFDSWLKKYISKAKSYSESHPDAPYKL